MPCARYAERGHRAEPGQLGFCRNRTVRAFLCHLRAAGLPVEGLPREEIPLGRHGTNTVRLATRPVPFLLPGEVLAVWQREWDAGAGDDPRPERIYARADWPDRIAAYLRRQGGGSAMPHEITAAIDCPRSAVKNAIRADT
jgi:hypothetical protein